MLKIFKISNYIENQFNKKNVYFFKSLKENGFAYPWPEKFQHSIHDQVQTHHPEDAFKLQILCGAEKIISTSNQNRFFSFLNTHTLCSPLFVVCPYFALSENPKEPFFACSCQAKITLTLDSQKKWSLAFESYCSNPSLDFIKQGIEAILRDPNEPDTHEHTAPQNLSWDFSSDDKARMTQKIENAIEEMVKGNCYLANITCTVPIAGQFLDQMSFLQHWLCLKSRYAVYYKDTACGIACFSPEQFLSQKKNRVSTQPIKGTLKHKGKNTLRQSMHLWKNKKEMHEHTMVVDLLRHDLNAICQPGSVVVENPFFVKQAQNLLQMQSNICGTVRQNQNWGDCLQAVLPAGSITGTPKSTVCKMIAKEEENDRGYYTGICGIKEKNGDFDSCILIRSLFWNPQGIYAGTGAGVTTLSDPKSEVDEFEQKLKSFLSFF